jgi:aminosugar N-oxygenase
VVATAPRTDIDAPAFPLRRLDPFATPPLYQQLRAERPIARVRMLGGNVAWLVTRHEDVVKVLSDRRLSVDRRHPGFPRFAPGSDADRNASFRSFRRPLNWMDPPEHTEARRALVEEFTAARTASLRPRVERIVERQLDLILASRPPVDLVSTLALPVPSRVICEVLGVPYDGHDVFERATIELFCRDVAAVDRARAGHEIRAYLDAVVTEKERESSDDLLGRLILRQRANGGVDHEGLVSTAFVLLVAGHATTASVISLGTLALLEHPDELARLRADSVRTPAAVEELLRYCSVVEASTARVALEDVEIGGVVISAGEGVVALGQTANRDPEVFDEPDRLDVRRDSRRHVAFGAGCHKCLGIHLARLELQVVFDSLFRRIPDLRLATRATDLELVDAANIYGLHALPVTWGRAVSLRNKL